jgi:transcriptional/translational regulatory protein YebC/TACO1
MLVPVTGDAVATLMKLLDALNDDDDVQNVYSNEEISDDDAAKLG